MTSPADALAVFDRWYLAHEDCDLERLAAVLADDVTVYSLFRAAPVRGRTAAVKHFQGTVSAFPDLTMPVMSGPVATPEGAVLAEVKFTGVFTGNLMWNEVEHSGSGQRFMVPGVVVLHTTNQQVISVKTLFDRDQWLRQIGVPVTTGRPSAVALASTEAYQ